MNKQMLRSIIFVGLFAIPFVPFLVWGQLFFPFITTKAFVFRIIVEIIFALWLVLAVSWPEYRPKKSFILYSVFIFLGIIGLADIFGIAPVKSFWSNFERMEGFIALLHFGALFIVAGSVFHEVDWRRWWNISLFASFIMVIYGLLQLGGSLAINQGGVRVDGTLGNASYLAVYMLFHIFVALYLMCQTQKNKVLKWAYVVLIVLQTFILYHTATRGAILGLFGGLLVIAILNIRNKENIKMRKISYATLGLIVVLAGGFWLVRNSSFVNESPVLSRFSTISTEEFKTGGRSFVWPMALKGIAERPILGWGQDNFNYVFNQNYKPEMYALEPWFDRAHNIFLDWGVAGGLLGLLAYLSFYIILIYLIWRKPARQSGGGDESFSYTEKTVLTGLLVGYFFHNLFVFDHLISYVLFFGLLAYIHSRNTNGEFRFLSGDKPTSMLMKNITLSTVSILLLLSLYFVNVKPLQSNARLIDALIGLQTPDTDPAEVMKSLEDAYRGARLGQPEVVEQITYHSAELLSGGASVEQKNEFYTFARQVAIDQAEEFSGDTRYQLMTGSFLSTMGSIDEALVYLTRAKEISPGKQQVYFELGSALINKGETAEGLQEFKNAYELAPDNPEAKVIYLIGAIYARDRNLEYQLLQSLPEDIVVVDRRILSTYVVNKRYTEAIAILRVMGEMDPNFKSQAEEYIKQIQAGL
ncbi:MAG: O-antigen ligase family protein [bacterium]